MDNGVSLPWSRGKKEQNHEKEPHDLPARTRARALSLFLSLSLSLSLSLVASLRYLESAVGHRRR